MPTLLVVQLDPSDPPARMGEWLSAAGLDLHLVALDAGEPLPSLDGFDGLVVLGGFMSAWQDDIAPFLPAVRALLREAVSREVPTLGICLGHQLLAAANGGQVRRRPDGPEIGALLVAKRGAASTDPLFGPLPITPDVLQWHFDEVSALPPGAIHLASSPGSRSPGVSSRPAGLGHPVPHRDHARDHPELGRRSRRPASTTTTWSHRRPREAAHDDIAEVWQPFAVAFADVVRDPGSVRRRAVCRPRPRHR